MFILWIVSSAYRMQTFKCLSLVDVKPTNSFLKFNITLCRGYETIELAVRDVTAACVGLNRTEEVKVTSFDAVFPRGLSIGGFFNVIPDALVYIIAKYGAFTMIWAQALILWSSH